MTKAGTTCSRPIMSSARFNPARRQEQTNMGRMNKRTRLERRLAGALTALMLDEGGEPRKRDRESARVWRRAQDALEAYMEPV